MSQGGMSGSTKRHSSSWKEWIRIKVMQDRECLLNEEMIEDSRPMEAKVKEKSMR